jgi:hypothetical protein
MFITKASAASTVRRCSAPSQHGNFGYLQNKRLHNCSTMFEKCSAVLVKTLKEEFKN